MISNKIYLSFQDVLIKPQLSNVNSRSEVDLTREFLEGTMKGWSPIPIMSANMDTITGPEMAWELLQRNWIPVLHKYVSKAEIKSLFDKIDEFNKINENKIDYRNLFISRGTTEQDKVKLKERLEFEPRIQSVCIDIANGHRAEVIDYIKELRSDICKDKVLMVGNVGSEDMVKHYIDAGVNIIKLGIGPGCFHPDTPIITDHGVKAIKDVTDHDRVLTHRNRFKKVLNVIPHVEKDMLIEINGIKSTRTHKYYVIDSKHQFTTDMSHLSKYAKFIAAEKLDPSKHVLVHISNDHVLSFKPIKSKKFFEYLGEVFDLEVEEDHSFNVKGIIVHNSACITRVKTGVGVPQISLIDNVVQESTNYEKYQKDFFVVSDGGCKVEGDLGKAFVAGADFVMIGGMLSGYKETPGVIDMIDGRKFKRFSGMAAKESQHNGVPNHGTEEGKTVMVPYQGKVYHKLQNIEGGIRSTCTYVNAKNVLELKNAELIQTNVQENKIFK